MSPAAASLAQFGTSVYRFGIATSPPKYGLISHRRPTRQDRVQTRLADAIELDFAPFPDGTIWFCRCATAIFRDGCGVNGPLRCASERDRSMPIL